VYYFFLAVVVRCKITATTVWALLFIVSAFFTHNCCCSLDRFSRVPGGCYRTFRDYIRRCFTDPAQAAAFAGEFAAPAGSEWPAWCFPTLD